MALCSSCNSEITSNARFCHSCGGPINSGSTQVPSTHLSAPTQAAHVQLIRNVHYTDTGAVIEFEGISGNEAGNIIGGFFSQMGYRLESGSSLQAVYGKGSAVARVAVGGLVTREKYSVRVSQFGTVVRVEISSVMSGASGGFIGRSREKSGRNNLKQSLGLFLSQLPRR